MTPKRRIMDPAGKREAILAAGEEAFAAKGYTGATMAEIAVAADVAVGTVYRLFPDKPSLLAALHARMEDRFVAAMRKGWNTQERYEDKFDPMLDALFDQAQAVLHLMPLYALTRDIIGAADYLPGNRMIEAIKQQYRAGVKAGAFADQPPAVVAAIAYGMVDGALRAWGQSPTPARKRAVLGALKTIMRRAFLRRGG